MIWLLVAVGGGLGSMARHGLNQLIHQRTLGATFPYGIFAINVIGSFVIGLVGGIVSSERWTIGIDTRTFIVVGCLGGFTTFSSFSFDTFSLIRDGHAMQAVINVAGEVGLSLIAVAIGYRIGAAV